MKFYADFHIHSRYSRAVSKDLCPEGLFAGAIEKGILVVGTGDITHPAWIADLKDKLEPSKEHPGLFTLRAGIREMIRKADPGLAEGNTLFILTGEISSIYKKGDRTRKVHNLVFLSSLERAEKFNAVLANLGNIRSDGRPILGLDSRNILEIQLDADPDGFLVPAHIWTPWFSLLGSKSGFDSVEECFEDLSGHVFALETGLSSDPLMNWRISGLDRYTLISNSDAHSLAKLGREANIFDIHPSFENIKAALKGEERGGFLGTVEFFPEEGKYHFDGHRKCGARLHPDRTKALEGACPVCGKPVTVGVYHRVIDLADRSEKDAQKLRARKPAFHPAIPLREIISGVVGKGPATKTVTGEYQKIVKAGFSELQYLLEAGEEQLARAGGDRVGEAVMKMRRGEVRIEEGYDGEFGKIFIHAGAGAAAREEEQGSLLPEKDKKKIAQGKKEKEKDKEKKQGRVKKKPAAPVSDDDFAAALLDTKNHVCVIAGPGAGKTYSLVERIDRLVRQAGVAPSRITALAFTNKAALELAERLARRGIVAGVFTGTIHSLCMEIIASASPDRRPAVMSDSELNMLLGGIVDERLAGETAGERRRVKRKIMARFEQPGGAAGEAALEDEREKGVYDAYLEVVRRTGLLDYDTMIIEAAGALRRDATGAEAWKRRLGFVHVDEFQDVDAHQVELFRVMAEKLGSKIFAIGDPEQSIYGFRGGRREYILGFEKLFSGSRVIFLEKNRRSRPRIVQACEAMLEGCCGERPMRRCSALRGGEGKVELLGFESDADEAEFIAGSIRQLVGGTGVFSIEEGRVEGDGGGGLCFEDIAVLVRAGAVGAAIESALRKHAIPFEVRESGYALDRGGCAALIRMLRLRLGAASPFDLIGLLPERMQAGLLGSLMKGWVTTPGELARAAGALGADGPFWPSFIDSALGSGGPADVADDSESTRKAVDEAIALHAEWLEAGTGRPAGDDDPEAVDELRALFDVLGHDRKSLVDFLASGRVSDLLGVRPGNVKILTMHSAKGLEFDTVFVAGCDDAVVPWSFGSRDGERDEQEELRLLYVAMTRAREHLLVTHARSRRLWGKEIASGPSRFLASLEKSIPLRMIEKAKPKPRQAAALEKKKQLKLF
ncbi:MAG: UvrD-helicase domain-containing protein [Pseudomonadota bacterium]